MITAPSAFATEAATQVLTCQTPFVSTVESGTIQGAFTVTVAGPRQGATVSPLFAGSISVVRQIIIVDHAVNANLKAPAVGAVKIDVTALTSTGENGFSATLGDYEGDLTPSGKVEFNAQTKQVDVEFEGVKGRATCSVADLARG